MYLDRTVFWLMTLSVEGLVGEVDFFGYGECGGPCRYYGYVGSCVSGGC